ncbi:MAG TPA: hypothetical protein VJP82_04575 [Sphingomicrobium sp.]|nr:hypothetical protein [Sphingomicrobium sp.]
MNKAFHRSFATAQSGSVRESLVAAIERSELQSDPFDHITMQRLFDDSNYAALLAAMPDRGFYHELSHVDAMRSDGSSTRLRLYLYPELLQGLPDSQRRVWMPVAQALCSDDLVRAFKQKFRRALENRFEKPVERLRLYPVPILLRDQPGYRIGIHSDVSTKAITVQFFLPADASQRDIGTIFHAGESGAAAERTTQMPFLPATGYAFPVSKTASWHSAAQTTAADGERVSMMVTYYVDEGARAVLNNRLRRLGLRVGIHPRG